MKGLFLAKTLIEDRVLFRKLGLKPFENIEGNEQFLVGKYVFPCGSMVTIRVSCFPAQFWEFEIRSEECEKMWKAETGSGALSDFWPMVEKMVDGMFVVTSVEDKYKWEK